MKALDPLEEWKKNLPIEIENNLQVIIDICSKINSFDLLSYISFYNHLQDVEEYSDYRGDKHFFVSESIACQCLKNLYIENTTISDKEVLESFEKIQEATLKYCGMNDAYQMLKQNDRDNITSEIVSKIESESRHIRNPGHPRHHLSFSEELLKPFENKIESIFRFKLQDTIIIRKGITDFLQKKYKYYRDTAIENAKTHSKQTLKYKNKKISYEQLEIEIDNIEDIVNLSDSEIRRLFKLHFFSQLMINSSQFGSFTSSELADFLNIEEYNVKNFLNRFSCTFESVKNNENIYQPISILKHKPFIKYKDKYIIPSIPLLIWAVEEEIENEFKKDSKLFGKFIERKHEFLLEKSENYFRNLLPNAKLFTNLYYGDNETRLETDGLIILNDYLFIVEAKANRLSSKARSGHRLKTEDHLNDIVKSSYSQALRTLNYLNNKKNVVFQNKKRKKIEINIQDFKEVILISLTLEQLGNIVPILKTSDKLNYFDKDYFPWIISIYDLVVINDFFETPSLLLSYLNVRKKFLSYENTFIYEELDIIGYFLKGRGNAISSIIEKEKNEGVNDFFFEPETDFINNYYMYKDRHPNRFISKPSYFNNNDFKDLICKIDKSNLPLSLKISTNLMRYNQNSINHLSNKYKKTVKMFQKDKKLHDCSIFTKEHGGFGFTYMISKNEDELRETLINYIKHKKNEFLAKTWIGIGEINGVIRFIENA